MALNRKNLDVELGGAVRERRRQLGMSQLALASAVGVTFQTIQKYERGVTRLSVSRCVDIAQALNCRVGDLIANIDELAAPDLVHPFPSNPGLSLADAPALLRAYAAIPGPLRRAVIELLRDLADAKAGSGRKRR